jgi:hypothetical protein
MFSSRHFSAIAKNIYIERTYPQGRERTSRSLGAEDKASARHQAGCAIGCSADGTPGF